MKKIIFIACSFLFFTGCNNKESKTEGNTIDSTKMAEQPKEKLDYPYTLDKPYQEWQPGDQKHAVTVMKMIKAWETKNLTECVSYFGDSADIRLDMYHKVLSHDSIIAVLNMSWQDIKSIKVKMTDWESVVSKDGKEEWVTLWYKQVLINTKGKADSMNVVNDAKIVSGKIVVFDEKVQHYPAPSK